VIILPLPPVFLKLLAESNDPIEKKLDSNKAKDLNIQRVHYDEKSFRWALGQDACGTAKLAEGIVKFAEDIDKLEAKNKREIAEMKVQ